VNALDSLDGLVRELGGHLELRVGRKRKMPDTGLHRRDVTELRAVFPDVTVIEPVAEIQLAARRLERYVAHERRSA